MNFNAILAFIKKHVIPLSLGVVALIAVVIALVILPGMFTDLQTQLTARKEAYDKAVALRAEEANLTLPVLDTSGAPPTKLGGYPTKPVVDAINGYKDESGQTIKGAYEAFSEDTAKLVTEALTENTAQPVVGSAALNKPGAVQPDTNSGRPSPTTFSNFLKAYQAAVDGAPIVGPDGKGGIVLTYLPNSLGAKLKAGRPPTTEEIEARKQAVHQALLEHYGTGTTYDDKIRLADLAIPALERQRYADAATVYVSYSHPGDVSPILAFEMDPKCDPKTADPNKLTTLDTFKAQLSLWEQQYIADAIARVNDKSKKISESPIKHVVALRLTPFPLDNPVNSTPVPGQPGADPNAPAPEVVPDAGAAITRKYTASPLGHVPNPFYDPYSFQLQLRVDSTKIPQILAGLSKDHLIVIDSVQVTQFSLGTAARDGYFYGSAPMAELTISGEVLFLRDWLVKYMPREVKQLYLNSATSGSWSNTPGAAMPGAAPF